MKNIIICVIVSAFASFGVMSLSAQSVSAQGIPGVQAGGGCACNATQCCCGGVVLIGGWSRTAEISCR